ncbi:threonine ammonia-lyase [Orenia metallireducens]|uniref:L-threonine dehydratase catabolic TdcB n=1 Tax=Orenia metallireducens TaxID=1413210 RepID=A0A1C0A9S5_9FIRM|nr:threonine ammonia-lyase [Orenia metallireducens]OCL27019.1 threonine ammonia-lyase [Orenia metallireducens]
MVRLEDIKDAQNRLKGVIKRSNLDSSRTFSQLSGNQVYLKLENLQKTGSFKLRGAYNKISNLTAKEKEKGVVAASAGNHAQGVALAATQIGIKSTIIMPKGAPIAKIKATRGYGAEVILSGETYDEAHQKELEYAQKTGATIIPAFDDLDVIAGQGTIGLEILEDLPKVDAVIAPVGGGGLIAGIAIAIKEINPRIKVIGVEADKAASMKASLKAGKPIDLTEVNTIADGIAVKRPGKLTYEIISKYVDEIVTVDDEEIAYAISILLERAKLIVEGAGATALAAVLNNKASLQGKKIAVILSGGNIDLDMISAIISRGMMKAGRRLTFTTLLPDIPGALERLAGIIGRSGANIISVHHDRMNPDISLKQAEVKLVLETRDSAHISEVISILKNQGYSIKL